MKIELVNLQIEAIRDFNELVLNFGSPSPNHITTIQMPNGTGKTTTLLLLKLLFSGKVLTKQEIVDFKPTLFEASEGLAKMNITIDGSAYTIELRLNYDEESYQYYTRSPAIGGHEEGHHIPPRFRLTPDLVNLFVFNGEIATDLFKTTSKTAELAIDSLYGLSKVEELVDKVRDHKQTIKDNNKTKITKSSTLDQKRARLIVLEDCKDRMEVELKEDQDRIDEIDGELDAVQEELNKLQNPETRSKMESLRASIKQAEKDIETKTQELRGIGINPMALSDYFSESLTQLKDQMDTLKLPRGTSTEFFQELCDSDTCICGTKMTPELKKSIMANSVKYLSDDLAGIMNSVKTEISNWKDDTSSYKGIVSEISAIKRKMNEDRQEYLALEKSSGGKDSQKRYSELLEQKHTLESEKRECMYSIAFAKDDYNNNDPETNINLCEEAIRALKAEIGAGDQVIHKLNLCDKAMSLLNEIYDVAMRQLKSHVIKVTNETLYPIMGDEIVVKNIDKSIILKNKPIGSEGQVLTTGYAYISALFKDSEFKLPFIIDSPCGSLDLNKRAYVAKKIPGLFDQVVFFVTSSERLRFTDVLEKMENINPYTVWKEDVGDKKIIMMSQDSKFFNEFQMNDEEE